MFKSTRITVLIMVLALQPMLMATTYAQKSVRPGNIYALVIGISAYENGVDAVNAERDELIKLKWAAIDAERFREMLLKAGVPNENIFYLTDKDATKTAILDALAWLVEKSAEPGTGSP